MQGISRQDEGIFKFDFRFKILASWAWVCAGGRARLPGQMPGGPTEHNALRNLVTAHQVTRQPQVHAQPGKQPYPIDQEIFLTQSQLHSSGTGQKSDSCSIPPL
jgi:hypothetical protein